MQRKKLIAKVSDSTGIFITAWENITFQGFTKTLNGGLGECVIRYGVSFDYDAKDLQLNNDVELQISDADTLADASATPFGTRTIYNGYISLIERTIDAGGEAVIIHLLGYYTLLSLNVLKDGANTTLYSDNATGLGTADDAAAGVEEMVRAVIDLFQAEVGTTKIFYSTESVPASVSSVKCTFAQKTYREAIDTLKSYAPSNVYWYVDETGLLTFREIASSPQHTFILGRHINRIRVERSVEKVRNAVLIWNGDPAGIYKYYQDDASVALYGLRMERINDYSIADEDAADALASKFLTENKDPAIKIVATIVDNASNRSEVTEISNTYGDDLVTNGSFAGSATDWDVGGNWAYSSGTLLHTPGATDESSQDIGADEDSLYRISLTVTGTTGSIEVGLGNHDTELCELISAGAGQVTFELPCQGSSYIRMFPSTDFDGSIDNVVVQEVAIAEEESDLITTGGFTGNADDWTLGANWAYSSNAVAHTPGDNDVLYQEYVGADAAGVFRVYITVTGTAGSVDVTIGGSATSETIAAGAGSVSFDRTGYVSASDPLIEIQPTSDFDGTIDSVSIVPLTAIGPQTRVFETGTDIETINPGDTCCFKGFSSQLSDIFRDNMLITRVAYDLDKIDIEVELTKSGIIDVQSQQGRSITDIGNGGLGIPETYT